jgi:FAD:protein FMN transferase
MVDANENMAEDRTHHRTHVADGNAVFRKICSDGRGGTRGMRFAHHWSRDCHSAIHYGSNRLFVFRGHHFRIDVKKTGQKGDRLNPPLTKNGVYPKTGIEMTWLFLFLFSLIVFPHSAQSFNPYRYHQVAMGTTVEITLMGIHEEEATRAAMQAFQEIKRIEQLMSPKAASGDVFRINQSAGAEWVSVSPETLQVILKAREISELSEGSFDITVAPLTQIWRAAREKGIPPSVEEVGKVLVLVNYRELRIAPEGKVLLKKKGMAIDLGGIAKGYAVDRAFEILQSLGYKDFIVNAGGDLRVGGHRLNQPWTIGIQHPRKPQNLLAKVSLSDAAMATSGNYEKFFMYQGKRYGHIFDPRDGFPTEASLSVSIIHKNCMTADALATTVFVLGPARGYALCQTLDGVNCVLVDKDDKVVFSPGLKDHLSFVP